MTSSSPLPAHLISTLIPFSSPFHRTANQFRSRLSTDVEFTRICELHNTLDLLAGSKSPTSLLWTLRGGAPEQVGIDSKQDAEDLLALMLNSEFVLYEMYSEYEIALNPSLAHWIGLCREFEKFVKESGDREDKWGLRERIMKIRTAFVKGILGDQGPMLAGTSPENFALRGLDFDIDVSLFRDALRSQGIYDTPDLDTMSAEDGVVDEREPTTTPSPPPVQPQPTQTPTVHDVQAQVTSIIAQAAIEELAPELVTRLLSCLETNPSLLGPYSLELINSTSISNMFSSNPRLTQGVIILVLSHGDKAQRRDMILTLEFLPISLQALEMLNDLMHILDPEETRYVVNGVLENGIRYAERLAPRTEEQNRIVRLLCLWIQSLMRADKVDFRDVVYQIQDLGMKFIYVKEARELWTLYCAP